MADQESVGHETRTSVVSLLPPYPLKTWQAGHAAIICRQISTDLCRRQYHPLGECGVAFFAASDLAARLSGDFPQRLDGAPLLMPGEDSALRAPLTRWLERGNLRSRIVGEFDDSALMKAFGKAGAGVFPAPSATREEVESQYGVVWLGETKEIRERFFAISVERRIDHPAVRAVSEGARGGLFAEHGG
jgi:LysR family transcriptional activator of nhaA